MVFLRLQLRFRPEVHDGNFYGTTTIGGTHNGGTVFKITPAGEETILWDFGVFGSDNLNGIKGVSRQRASRSSGCCSSSVLSKGVARTG
jgi:uncharacterized repeat protein (TIGR03803 family)